MGEEWAVGFVKIEFKIEDEIRQGVVIGVSAIRCAVGIVYFSRDDYWKMVTTVWVV